MRSMGPSTTTRAAERDERGAEWADREPAPRVLVAEDDDEMRRFLVAALRNNGYEVVAVANGWELLDALAAQLRERVSPIKLIISDLRMPDVTGFKVLDCLRRAEWRTPFILITAFGGCEVTEEARQRGAVAVFDKPFDIDDLRTAVGHFIRKRVTPIPRGPAGRDG